MKRQKAKPGRLSVVCSHHVLRPRAGQVGTRLRETTLLPGQPAMRRRPLRPDDPVPARLACRTRPVQEPSRLIEVAPMQEQAGFFCVDPGRNGTDSWSDLLPDLAEDVLASATPALHQVMPGLPKSSHPGQNSGPIGGFPGCLDVL